MKTLLLCVALLSGVAAVHANQKEGTPLDMSAAKKVFIGWVDISLNDWLPLGYENKEAWKDVITWNNEAFQSVSQAQLPDRQVTGAKDGSDDNTSGQDLYVKFSDVRFDTDTYRLYLAIHFIDPRSGSEVGSVPLSGYRGGRFSVNNCLQGALKKVAEKIREQIRRSDKR